MKGWSRYSPHVYMLSWTNMFNIYSLHQFRGDVGKKYPLCSFSSVVLTCSMEIKIWRMWKLCLWERKQVHRGLLAALSGQWSNLGWWPQVSCNHYPIITFQQPQQKIEKFNPQIMAVTRRIEQTWYLSNFLYQHIFQNMKINQRKRFNRNIFII